MPGLLYLLGVIPAAAASLPRLIGLPGAVLFGGWSSGFHFAVFALGCLVFSEPRLELLVSRQRGLSIAFAALLVAGAALCPLLSGFPEAALIALRAMAAWALSLAFLGLGVARLSGFRPAPAFLNEAALPFFLLGWPAARFIGSRLAGWPVSAGLRYAVLSLTAFAAVSAVYAVIRRLTLLRFLFGLKPLVNVVNEGGST